LRELAVQSSNDTNIDTDRAFIQEEVNLLVAEITRISSNTRYNGQLVLDGSFSNRQMQVGTEGGETITVNVDSVASDVLGAYEVTGDRVEAFNGNGAGSYGNITDAADDIIINGNSLSKTIDVAAADSAKAVAAKINDVSGETGVTATAKSYGLLSSEFATDETYSVLINNKTTGSFVISNSNVLDAVDKINAISGSTGVTATATTDNKVRLYSSDGSDILVENQSTGTALKVQTMSHDGESVQPAKYWHKALSEEAGSAQGISDGTYTLLQTSTNQTWQFTLDAGTDNEPTAAELQAAINSISGVSGFNVSDNGNQTNPSSVVVTATESFGDFEIYSGTSAAVAANKQTDQGYGTVAVWDTATDANEPSTSSVSYVLRNLSTGTNYDFTITAAGTLAASEIRPD
jgi:flagellin-like hook-associated protein FlgL